MFATLQFVGYYICMPRQYMFAALYHACHCRSTQPEWMLAMYVLTHAQYRTAFLRLCYVCHYTWWHPFTCAHHHSTRMIRYVMYIIAQGDHCCHYTFPQSSHARSLIVQSACCFPLDHPTVGQLTITPSFNILMQRNILKLFLKSPKLCLHLS